MKRLGSATSLHIKHNIGDWVVFGENYRGKPRKPHIGVIQAVWASGRKVRYVVKCANTLWSVSQDELRIFI